MKKITSMVAAMVLTGSAFGAELVNVAGASEIALSGYDAVAFFTMGKPVHGDPSITATHEGATYLFASKENMKAFKKDPQHYAPQFGGFCAFGVSVGALFPVDISTWQIKNDKLYVNLNPTILDMFNKDLDGNIAKANKKWPGIVKKHAKK